MARSRQVRIVVAQLEGAVDFIIKRLVLDIVRRLVAAPSEGGTPVDTGWARANWIPSIGAPRTEPAGTRKQAEAGILPGEQQSGLAAMLSYTAARGPAHITNNVPYILALDAGHSRQAASGFVGRAIARAVTELR